MKAQVALRQLVRLVGPSAASEIFFTARRYRADEALRMGLVNAIFPAAELEASVRKTWSRARRRLRRLLAVEVNDATA